MAVSTPTHNTIVYRSPADLSVDILTTPGDESIYLVFGALGAETSIMLPLDEAEKFKYLLGKHLRIARSTPVEAVE